MPNQQNMIFRGVKVLVHTMMGWDIPIENYERSLLEQKIMPYFANQINMKKVLFVGCGSYTKHYQKIFTQQEYWTIDINPLKKVYGAKHHIVDSMSNLGNYFQPEELDLIICNGVFGWGLNEREAVEAAFVASYNCLRDRGILLIGWDDVPEHKPFGLETLDSITKFKPYNFPPLNTWRYNNPNDSEDHHYYDFYQK